MHRDEVISAAFEAARRIDCVYSVQSMFSTAPKGSIRIIQCYN